MSVLQLLGNAFIDADDSFSKLFDYDFITNCQIHGNNVEALLNGKCLKCREDDENRKTLEAFENSMRLRKNDSGVFERYIDCNFDNFVISSDMQRIRVEQLKAYDFKQNIVVNGSVGVGKTHLAHALIDKVLRLNKTAYYTKYYQLAKTEINDKKLFEKIISSYFLIVDEYGVSESDYKNDLLFRIIDTRYDRKLPLMLISNLDSDELRKSMSDAAYSRIKENCLSLVCKWEDYRLKHK